MKNLVNEIMTPKEKANRLGNRFYQGSVFDYDKQGHLDEIVKAKHRAKICVQEIIISLSILESPGALADQIDYWDTVLTEIEALGKD
jgi:hypothetical protein